MRTPAHPTPQWYEFDRQVDYGYPAHESLDPRPPFHQPFPTTPPPAAKPGEFCGCPACLSGGWYPVSPACRFWRADCDLCGGTRRRADRTGLWRRWRRVACYRCQETWQAAVQWFYFTLRNPHAAAEAVRQTVHHRYGSQDTTATRHRLPHQRKSASNPRTRAGRSVPGLQEVVTAWAVFPPRKGNRHVQDHEADPDEC